jgi:hypothetical protein
MKSIFGKLDSLNDLQIAALLFSLALPIRLAYVSVAPSLDPFLKAVALTGAVPYSDIPAYLGIADLEAHWFQPNNPQNKTLGIAALEAMSAGKVVF